MISVEKQVNKIRDTLDRMQRGLYADIPISRITDKIAWLWKFRYIDEETMEELTSLAIEALKVVEYR